MRGKEQAGYRRVVFPPALLRGRREQLGVLQAFSLTPWAFTDNDIRCFELFAELVLSALKPEDQDRRINWLSCLAGEVLRAKPAVAVPVVAEATSEAPKVEPIPPVVATKQETDQEAELAPAPVPAFAKTRFAVCWW